MMKLSKNQSLQTTEQQIKAQKIFGDQFYTIQCKSTNFALRQQIRTYKRQLGDKLRIIGNKFDDEHINFLWMFKHIENEYYEIVHAKTDLVLTVDDYMLKLDYGKRKTSQIFKFSRSTSGYRIKTLDGFTLSLEGILQTSELVEREESQLFTFQPFRLFEIGWLTQTIFFLTESSRQSIDLQNGARKEQQKIILYEANYRMNQRWRIEFVTDEEENSGKVYIKNALSGQFLTYNKEDNLFKQTPYPEEWKIERINNEDQGYIFHVKQHKYLSFDEDHRLTLDEVSKKWVILNSDSVNKKIGYKLKRFQSI